MKRVSVVAGSLGGAKLVALTGCAISMLLRDTQ